MGAKAAISEQEYLHTSFPGLDREYRHGTVVERSMPDYLHSKTQALLVAFFFALRQSLRLYPCPELRLRLGSGLFRIPDLSVFHPDEPTTAVPDIPPFIAIEILSPDDRMNDVTSKLGEYKNWGVPHVWLVDPHGKRMYTCDQGLAEVPSLRIPELGLELTSSTLFD